MKKYLPLFLLMSVCSSCKKILEVSDPVIVIETVRQALDDNLLGRTVAFGEFSTTDYYAIDAEWSFSTAVEANAYIWEKDFYGYDSKATINDWNIPYQNISIANEALEQLNKITITNENQTEWKAIKGTALFLRAYSFFNLLQIFSLPYDSLTSKTDLGIPIRLVFDVSQIEQRSSVSNSYDRVLKDLNDAKDLLTGLIDLDNRNRPCRSAVMALLSRTYLSMRDYSHAGLYADSSLLYNQLINYNSVDTTLLYPFSALNSETLYQSYFSEPVLNELRQKGVYCAVDTALYNSYDPNDLRRSIFWVKSSGNIYPACDYSSSFTTFFSGLAVDEMYLNRAECYARAGNTNAAMQDLNTLLVNRYKTGKFVPLTAMDSKDALLKILIERRKELPFRGLHWIDIRRLNAEGAGIILKRTVYGHDYTLNPNSPLYALPIPPNEYLLSGIKQNPR